MNDLSEPLRKYVRSTSGLEISPERAVRPRRPYIADLYDLSVARIDGTNVGIIYVKDPAHFTPGQFLKHFASIEPDIGGSYVVVASALSSHVKTRLVEQGIPFVVPGRQMNWPALGAVHRHRAVRAPVVFGKRVSPTAQLVVVSHLSGSLPAGMTLQQMAMHFGLSSMSMSRAMREIEASGKAEVERDGHTIRLRWTAGKRVVWESFRDRMRDPVLHTLRVELSSASGLKPLRAGEAALAEKSMLSPPNIDVRACRLPLSKIPGSGLVEAAESVNDVIDLQFWSYDPMKASQDKRTVDPFSLLLSLRDDADPRISEALDEMMEAVDWS